MEPALSLSFLRCYGSFAHLKGAVDIVSIIGKHTFVSLFWIGHISYFFPYMHFLPARRFETTTLHRLLNYQAAEATFFPTLSSVVLEVPKVYLAPH